MTCVLFVLIFVSSFFGHLTTASAPIKINEEAGHQLGSLLTQLISLHHRWKPMRCAALMTDLHYLNRFSTAKLNEDAPLLLDEIQLDQKPLRNGTIFEALERVMVQDCNVIALFFSNGKKLARILRISDRNRLIKSRALFLLPFDVRLFLPKMHNFWRRFLNVIFIRDLATSPLRRDSYSNKNAIADASEQCFELSTVSFPTPVDPDHPETWLPPTIATWCRGRFYDKKKPLFYAKNKNLRGEVLKAAYFELSPSVVRLEVKNGAKFKKLQGVEIGILDLLSSAMNFSPLLLKVANMSSGAIESLASGSADIALGNFAYLPSLEKSNDLSAPYATFCYTFITPELVGDVSWQALVLPFDRLLWAVAALALVVGWFSMHLTARLQKNEEQSEMAFLLPSALSTLSMQLLVPLPRAPQGWPLRMLFCTFWLHCLLLSVSYRASFASHLAKPPPRIAVDTVDKLAEAKFLRPITYDDFAIEMFNTSLDVSGKIIAERMEKVLMEPIEIVEQIKNGQLAFFGNAYLLRSLKTLAENMEVGKYSVHVNEECVISLPVSLGLARNSALTPQVDKIVKRAVENGLVTKWLQESEYKSVPVTEGAQQALVDLPKMVSIFAAFGCGMCISLLAFVAELLFKNRARLCRKRS